VRRNKVDLPPAKLVIYDEAHTLMSDEALALMRMYKDAFIIGTTATPARSDGKGLGQFFTAMECAVPTSQLIREGHLVPFRAFDARQERWKAGKRTKGLMGDPVAAWLSHAGNKPTVLFAAKVTESKAVVESFQTAGISAAHIDADTHDNERATLFDRLRSGSLKVLSNVACLIEGVDVPELACVQFLRTAGSYVLYKQATGRCSRPAPGKTEARIIDHSGCVETHGFPDEDVEWSLAEEDTVEGRIQRRKKAGQMREPVVCRQCSLIFSNLPACPKCGTPLPRARKKAQEAITRPALLAEVERGEAAHETPQEKQARAKKTWAECIQIAVAKGLRAGAAASMFRSQFGRWPDQFPNLGNVPLSSVWLQPASQVFPWAVRHGKPGTP
jgi:superfamily II DNA or RNA helicase